MGLFKKCYCRRVHHPHVEVESTNEKSSQYHSLHTVQDIFSCLYHIPSISTHHLLDELFILMILYHPAIKKKGAGKFKYDDLSKLFWLGVSFDSGCLIESPHHLGHLLVGVVL